MILLCLLLIPLFVFFVFKWSDYDIKQELDRMEKIYKEGEK